MLSKIQNFACWIFRGIKAKCGKNNNCHFVTLWQNVLRMCVIQQFPSKVTAHGQQKLKKKSPDSTGLRTGKHTTNLPSYSKIPFHNMWSTISDQVTCNLPQLRNRPSTRPYWAHCLKRNQTISHANNTMMILYMVPVWGRCLGEWIIRSVGSQSPTQAARSG